MVCVSVASSVQPPQPASFRSRMTERVASLFEASRPKTASVQLLRSELRSQLRACATPRSLYASDGSKPRSTLLGTTRALKRAAADRVFESMRQRFASMQSGAPVPRTPDRADWSVH